MKLTDEQLLALRKPFKQIGAFEGYSEEEIKKLLEEIATFYVEMAKINLRIKHEDEQKQH